MVMLLNASYASAQNLWQKIKNSAKQEMGNIMNSTVNNGSSAAPQGGQGGPGYRYPYGRPQNVQDLSGMLSPSSSDRPYPVYGAPTGTSPGSSAPQAGTWQSGISPSGAMPGSAGLGSVIAHPVSSAMQKIQKLEQHYSGLYPQAAGAVNRAAGVPVIPGSSQQTGLSSSGNAGSSGPSVYGTSGNYPSEGDPARYGPHPGPVMGTMNQNERGDTWRCLMPVDQPKKLSPGATGMPGGRVAHKRRTAP